MLKRDKRKKKRVKKRKSWKETPEADERTSDSAVDWLRVHGGRLMSRLIRGSRWGVGGAGRRCKEEAPLTKPPQPLWDSEIRERNIYRQIDNPEIWLD